MPNSILISILAASFFIIIAIIVGKALYGAFATDDKKCQNYMEWEKFNTAFENLESNSIEETIFFYNENCNIVSFSPKINLQDNLIKPSFNPGNDPRVCLCKIEENVCNPSKCYKFSDFEDVSFEGKQFSTYDKSPYALIKLRKEGKTLKISGVLQDKQKLQLEQSVDEKNLQFNTGGKRDISNINLIVLHHTGGHTAESAIETLEERELSVHYVLDENGKLQQLVPDDYIAYHAKGGHNANSIGIEIVNTGKRNDPYENAQYASLRVLLSELTRKYNIPYDAEHIQGHYELSGNSDKWDPSPNFDWSLIGINKKFPVELCESKSLVQEGYDCSLIA